MSKKDPLKNMLNEDVVLDTATSIIYIGKLIDITDHTFVLESADMHDCRDGHANKELYLAEAVLNGIETNRKIIIVMRPTVISLSRLNDIVTS